MDIPKQRKPIQVRLPFDLQKDVGLGDAIKRVTTAVGMKPCKGCEQRAATLNRHMVFTTRRAR